MHATIGIFKMDPARLAAQQPELHERIIPMVRQQPGFIAGSWAYDHAASRSYPYILWETEEAARAFAALVREIHSRPNPFGVELESMTVLEVLAEARAR